MEALAVLLGFISIIAFLLFIPALIWPRVFVKWGKRTRVGALAYIGVWFFTLIVGAVLMPQEETQLKAEKTQNIQEAQPEAAAQEEAKPVAQEEPEPVAPVATKEPMKEPVTLSLYVQVDKTFRAVVTATTNLPDGTNFMLSVDEKNAQAGFSGQGKGVVSSGSLAFPLIGPLSNGDYLASVVMPVPGVQPDNVKAVIGSNGEYLTGNLVDDGTFGKTIEQTVTFTVEGSTPSPATLIPEFKKEFAEQYKYLLKMKNDPHFWEYGFSGGGKYHQWDMRVAERDKKYPKQILFSTGIFFGELGQMARVYMRSKGQETEYTRNMHKQIKEALARD